MLLRPTHPRVIMPAVITGRDSTARYSAMRGPTAAWRAMAQGGPHQEAMAISLSDLDCSLQMTRRARKRAPVTAVLTGRPSMLRPEMKSPTAVPAALIKERSIAQRLLVILLKRLLSDFNYQYPGYPTNADGFARGISDEFEQCRFFDDTRPHS